MLCDLDVSLDRPSGTRAGNGNVAYKFGAFDLCVGRRLLTESGRPVQVGSRALDILGVLVAHAGEIVSKDAIIAHVWPTTFVDDANLRVQIGRLRRALGDGEGGARYIVNIPIRGYSFVAPVSRDIDRAPHDSFITTRRERVSNHVQA